MKQKGRFNYVALIAILFAGLLAILFLSRGFSTESGSVGLNKEVGVGEKAAPFAVPIAMSDLDGDANVDPEQACSVAGDDVLRICDFFDRPLVMSFWFTKGASSCIDQQDAFEEVAAEYSAHLPRENGSPRAISFAIDRPASSAFTSGSAPRWKVTLPN